MNSGVTTRPKIVPSRIPLFARPTARTRSFSGTHRSNRLKKEG